MPKVIFLVGVYGAGKSHLIEERRQNGIWNKDDYVVVSIDRFLVKDAKKQKITHDQAYINSLIIGDMTGFDNVDRCCNLMKEIFKGNKNIIIDNPNSSIYVRKRYIDIIPRNYTIEAVYFEIKDEKAYLKRLEKRNKENDNKTISSERALELLKAIEKPSIEEGFSNIEVVSNI